jgi:hypothetical protein
MKDAYSEDKGTISVSERQKVFGDPIKAFNGNEAALAFLNRVSYPVIAVFKQDGFDDALDCAWNVAYDQYEDPEVNVNGAGDHAFNCGFVFPTDDGRWIEVTVSGASDLDAMERDFKIANRLSWWTKVSSTPSPTVHPTVRQQLLDAGASELVEEILAEEAAA